MSVETLNHPHRKNHKKFIFNSRWLNAGFSSLDIYVLGQLGFYLTLAVLALTLTLLFSDALLDLLLDLQQFGFPLTVGVTLVALQIPKLVATALPMGAVLAGLLTYNHLNKTLEVIPIRMAGVSLYRMAVPAFLLGLFTCLTMFWLNNMIVPQCITLTKTMRALALAQYALPLNQAHFSYKQFDTKGNLKRLLYVEQINNRSLESVIVLDLTRPETLQITQAQKGEWTGETIDLQNASVYTVAADGGLSNSTNAKTLVLDNFLSLPKFTLKQKPQDQSIQTIGNEMKQALETKHFVEPKLVMIFWSKVFFPLATIPLVLLAIPFTMRGPRQKNHFGFAVVLLLTFGFYVLEHTTSQLAGVLPLGLPLIAALPLIVLSVLVVVLFERKNHQLA